MNGKHRTLTASIDEKLDQALADSFPASDPVAFIEPGPVKDGDRELPVVAAARDGRKPRSRKSRATRT